MSKVGTLANLTCDSGGSGAYVTLMTYVEVKYDGVKVTAVDTSDLTSFSKTFIPGMVDYGSITCVGNYAKTDYTALLALVRVSHNFKLTEPDGSTGSQTMTAAGFIEEVSGPEFKNDEVARVTVKIKLSGALTLGTAP